MRWRTVFLYVLLQCFAVSQDAFAQEDAARAASARALFEEGVVLADSAQWSDAADRFQRALSLRDSPVIRFNLASALVEVNRLVEASELLHQIERDATADEQLRRDAIKRIAGITPRIAKLTIELDGNFSGISVRLDDRELAAAMIGMAMPIDPGVHQLRALRAEHEVDSETVELAEGAAQRVVLSAVRIPSPEQAAATMDVASASAPRNDQDDKRHRPRLMWWGIGGGVVAVAAAAIVTLIATKDSGASSPEPYQGNFEPSSVPVQVSR